MFSARNKRTYALVVLPLMLSVLLVSLCLPVTCTAATMAAGACPDCRTTAAQQQAQTPSPMANMPMHSSRTPAPKDCNHVTNANIQASTSDLQVRIAPTVVAMLPTFEAPAPAAQPILKQVAYDPSPPPSILNTAANLRV